MKLTPSFVLALAAATYGSASPIAKRATSSMGLPTPVASSASGSSSASAPMQTGMGGGMGSNSSSSSMTFNDTEILQYALTLEHLEATFYNESLSKLSTSDFENAGYNASVRDQIYSIGRDEAAHVEFLSKALGNNSIPACTYNFSGVTDVASFLTTARVLEGVGVSAYLGAAQNITNKQYLEAAGAILVVEGQHQSYLTAQTDDGGNAIPKPFATPLDFKQVYSLAAPFFASCPSNASLPLTAFPTLSLSGGASNGSFTPGQQVTVSYENSTTSSSNSSSSGNSTMYLAIIQGVTGPQFLTLDGNNSTVTLPSNLTGGQMYAVVTSSNKTVTDDNTLAGPAVGFVNIPLPQAPEATGSMSMSSSSSAYSASATSSGYGAGAGSTGSSSSSGAYPTSTGSMSSMSSMSGMSGMSTASASLPSSLASLGSANIPTSTASN